MLNISQNSHRMQIQHLETTLDILLPRFDPKEITTLHTWPWNRLSMNCPITYEPVQTGEFKEMILIPKQLMWYFCYIFVIFTYCLSIWSYANI